MKINLNYLTIILLFLFPPTSTQAVVAIQQPAGKIESKRALKKLKKKERKARRKITWKKVLKEGLLPLLQMVSLVVLVGTSAVGGSTLIGILFLNLVVLSAYIAMRKKENPDLKLSVVFSCVMIIVNLLLSRVPW